MKRRKNSEGATVRIATAESLIAWMTEGLLIQRYRDIDWGIRNEVLKTLGNCIISVNPDLFIDNAYLRYVGWSLSDKEEKLRASALQLLKDLYANAGTALTAFTDRFKSRIIEIASKDINTSCRKFACELIDKMLISGLLIVEECVELVRTIAIGHHACSYISSLDYTVNQVIFGQDSSQLNAKQICDALSAFESDPKGISTVSPCVHIDGTKMTSEHPSTDHLAIYFTLAASKHALLSTQSLLGSISEVSCDEERLALFTYLHTMSLIPEPESCNSILEGVISEVVKCRSEEPTSVGAKLLVKWRENDFLKLNIEQSIQTAILDCWAKVKKILAEVGSKRKIEDDDAPYIPLSILTSIRRLDLSVEDIELISLSLEQIEGIALLSRQKRARKRTPYMVYHRVLLLLYNDLLWTYSSSNSVELRIERLCTLKQLASISRPIMQNDCTLRKAAITVLTDIALLSKTTDDVPEIIESISSIEENAAKVDGEWKSIIVGKLFMSNLVEAKTAVPLLCRLRRESKICEEICRAAFERTKSNSASVLIEILSAMLSNVEDLKYAITHYRPVLKGVGVSIGESVHRLHQSIANNAEYDVQGSLLGFLFEELSIEQIESMGQPPSAFKLYRKTLGKIAQKKTGASAPHSRERYIDSASTEPTSVLTEEDYSNIHENMHDISLTSPGFDENALSLPNSPLDKIIRLE